MQSIEDYELQQQAMEADNLSSDDNAASEPDASDDDNGAESPLALALDDLESRVVSALNDFKSHPGRATDPRGPNVHDELAGVLRPVVEVSAHAGPATARALAASYPGLLRLDECVDEAYDRINADLVLPVVLESAQSDVVPAKRAASLALFHTLHKEWTRAGSYLDGTTGAPSLAGPYGPGVQPGSGTVSAPPFSASDASRRNQARIARRSELLRRWVQASIPNLAPGTFTDASLDSAAASRGVLSASSALKPCLRYMAERIGSADDAG